MKTPASDVAYVIKDKFEVYRAGPFTTHQQAKDALLEHEGCYIEEERTE